MEKCFNDDIDDYYDRIKMNKIKFTDKRLVIDSDIRTQRLYDLLQAPHSVKTFHLSMLSEKEERKIHSKKTGNRRFVNFGMKLSNKGENYALSLGLRKSFLCMSDTMNGKVHVQDVVEPDPWQENIKRNFEESLKQTKKRKAEEALEEYFQTHYESDSSDNFDSN